MATSNAAARGAGVALSTVADLLVHPCAAAAFVRAAPAASIERLLVTCTPRGRAPLCVHKGRGGRIGMSLVGSPKLQDIVCAHRTHPDELCGQEGRRVCP